MTREIKFEVLYKHKSKLRPEIIKKVYTLDDLMSTINLNSNHFIVIAKRQYTGRKDKNGVEIYEEDICRITETDEDSCCGREFEYIGYVAWKDGTWGFKDNVHRVMGKPDWTKHASLGEWLAEFEVIGNIYETPELLQGEE